MPEPAARPAQSAATTTRTDPYGSFNFKVEIRPFAEAHFTYCSGLGARIQAIKHREGGASQIVHRLPGRVEYSDVVLRYGLSNSRELWGWLESATRGQVVRHHVTITLLMADGVTEGVRFNLLNAWPSAWIGAPLDAMGNEVALEELTLVYEMLERG